MSTKIVLTDDQLTEPYEMIACGKSSREVAKVMGLSRGVMFREMTRTPERQMAYCTALVAKGAYLADEVMEVSDDPDIPADQKRIMVDSRKWLAGKYYGRLFGESREGANLQVNVHENQKRLVIEVASGKNTAKITQGEGEEDKEAVIET